MKKINETMMQYFEWYLKPEDNLWNKVVSEATFLSSLGVSHIWLPPAYKGSGGLYDTGYGVYDLYDLGEFDQKGSIRTKYGTKEEYLEAIKVLKANNIKVLADIVFNHRMGADGAEDVIATEENTYDRNQNVSEPRTIKAWTSFTFPGRNNMYSDFKWNRTHFHGVDWDDITQKNAIFKLVSAKSFPEGINDLFNTLLDELIKKNYIDKAAESVTILKRNHKMKKKKKFC